MAPSRAPKWPWADIKAKYYMAYPISKAEFFAKQFPQIPVKTWNQETVGWKEEREAYRTKYALENISKYMKMADTTAFRHAQRGAGLMDAALTQLTTKVIDGRTGEVSYVLKNGTSMETVELIRAFFIGAKVEAAGSEILRKIVTVHKDAEEKPERETLDTDRQLIQSILKSKDALKAARALLKALPQASA